MDGPLRVHKVHDSRASLAPSPRMIHVLLQAGHSAGPRASPCLVPAGQLAGLVPHAAHLQRPWLPAGHKPGTRLMTLGFRVARSRAPTWVVRPPVALIQSCCKDSPLPNFQLVIC